MVTAAMRPAKLADGTEPGRAVEGLYKVEYDISGGSGRSVLYAHAGRMLGGNTAFAHFGTYEMWTAKSSPG